MTKGTFKLNGHMRTAAFVGAVATALLSGGAARADLLTNGNFESVTPSGQPGNVFCSNAVNCPAGSITGWTTSDTGAYTTGQAGTGGGIVPTDASGANNMNADLSVGTLTQQFGTVKNATYQLDFFLAANGETVTGSDPDTLTISAGGYQWTIAGNALWTINITDSEWDPDPFSPTPYTPPSYLEFTDTFTASAASTIALTFTGDNTENGGLWLLDDVSVTCIENCTATTPVPEPASLGILGMALVGLVGLGAYRHRRARPAI